MSLAALSTAPTLDDVVALSTARTIDDAARAASHLGRLEWLVTRQLPPLAPQERVGLALAAFAAFFDCLDLGREAEAHELVEVLLQQETPALQPAA